MYPVEKLNFNCIFCFQSVFNEKLHICSCNMICCSEHLKSHNCSSQESIFYDQIIKSFDLTEEKFNEKSFNFLRDFATKNFNLQICSHFSFFDFCNLKFSEMLLVEKKCEKCEEKNENWICLNCQKYFCGRQIEKHGIEHFEEKKHSVFINKNSMIWCYSCENRVIIPHIGKKLSSYEDYELKLKASKKIIYEVDKIYPVEKITPNGRMILNENNICYMNSILQMLYSLLPIDTIDYNDIIMQYLNDENFDLLLFELLRILCNLKNNKLHNLNNFIIALLNKTSLFRNNEQHDANEFYFYLADYLENLFKTYTKFNLLTVLKIEYEVELDCKCGYKRKNMYSGYSLNIDMGDKLNADKLFLQRCSKCNKIIKASYHFISIPKYLIININRYSFDKHTSTVEKIEGKIKLDSIIIEERIMKKMGAILHYGNPISGHYMYQEGNMIYSDDMQYKCDEGLMEYGYMIVYG